MEHHILIIDDNTQELRKLREILTREGYNIMTATDYATAMQIYQRVPVKLILAKAPALGFPEQSF
ncbi:MAG: response regulator [Bacteroidetes bacterium]|nr:MAG: response regulator [Bacteroidota bacterium]